MRRISYKRESKKPKAVEVKGMHTVATDDPPTSLMQCYDSIVKCHKQGYLQLNPTIRPSYTFSSPLPKPLIKLQLPQLRWCLNRAQLQNLYEMQAGKCALTDLQMRPGAYEDPDGWQSIGLDFLRLNLGYIKSNCRLVCWPLAIGRAVRGRIGTLPPKVKDHRYVQSIEDRWMYTQHNVRVRTYDYEPHEDFVVRHSLMVIYLEHLRGFNLLKYYPIIAILNEGAITFRTFYYPANRKNWSGELNTRLQTTDFTKLYLDERCNLVVGNNKVERLIDYTNPEIDFCEDIDRAVVTSFKTWYQGVVQSRY